MSFLPIILFVTSLFIFTLWRRLTPRREGIRVMGGNPVSVKISEGETVTIKLKSLEAYEKEFGKGQLVPLWDGRSDNYKGYIIFFDSTTEKNRFSLGEYVISPSIWSKQKVVRNEFFFDSNNVKIDLKDMDAKFLIVPA
ncbi:MAG: hypothetical protein ACE5OW_07520 [Candidatus Bathyarchaeia archaeon]